MDLKEEEILGDAIADHWYYSSKSRAVMRLVGDRPARILDVGAGSGFFSKHLLENSAATEACCVDIGYDEERSTVHAGKPLSYRRSCNGYEADLLLYMDVLEHVDDDLGLLTAYLDQLQSGGRVLITVPAFSFLWSNHDIFLEHKRRYTLKQVEALIARAGLESERGCYYFGAVFPLAAGIRLGERLRGINADKPASQLKQHSPPVNAVLGGLCRLELPFFRFNRLAGLSVCVVARKP